MIVAPLAKDDNANATPAATLALAAQDQLEFSIVAGHLQPGAPLKEVALSAELGISSTPIRDALVHLSRSGLVDIISNKGKRVSLIDPQKMLDLLETRQVIMEWLIRRAAAHKSASFVRQAQMQLQLVESALRRDDTPRAIVSAVQIDTVIALHCQSPEAYRILRSREAYVARHLVSCLDAHSVHAMRHSLEA